MNRGEIYMAQLDAPGTLPGHEQLGYRPVLIISPQSYNRRSLFALTVPLTTTQSTESLPFTIPVEASFKNGLRERSILLVLQLRALDKRRIKSDKFLGNIEPDILAKVMRIIDEMT